jgi:hypothetical protein
MPVRRIPTASRQTNTVAPNERHPRWFWARYRTRQVIIRWSQVGISVRRYWLKKTLGTAGHLVDLWQRDGHLARRPGLARGEGHSAHPRRSTPARRPGRRRGRRTEEGHECCPWLGLGARRASVALGTRHHITTDPGVDRHAAGQALGNGWTVSSSLRHGLWRLPCDIPESRHS